MMNNRNKVDILLQHIQNEVSDGMTIVVKEIQPLLMLRRTSFCWLLDGSDCVGRRTDSIARAGRAGRAGWPGVQYSRCRTVRSSASVRTCTTIKSYVE